MFVYITFSFGRSKILIQLAILSRKLKSNYIILIIIHIITLNVRNLFSTYFCRVA